MNTQTEAGGKPDVGFVACIEGGALEAQALLLFESIRRYAGRFGGCDLYALSPRAGHPISTAARARLDELGAHYVDEVLNTECPEYGSANRVAAGAYVEQMYPHDLLVVLDSDTLFIREPAEFDLAPGVDVAVRPVDMKGMCTTGRRDPSDTYWRRLCHLSGLGILRRCADIFFASVRRGLRTNSGAEPFRAGAGWVEPASGQLWGSSQAALSLAIWSITRRVRQLPPTYNYPLHLHERLEPTLARATFPHLVHVHYHWLLAADALPANPLFQPRGPLSPEQQDWLRSAAPVG
jgi:hypothetical protein